MKTKLICCIAILLQLNLASAQNTVTLTGKLINFGNQVTVSDMSDFQYLEVPTNERVIIPESGGKFAITFNLAAPNYFRVGRNILYLSPGDKMEVFIDYNDSKKAIFNGTGQEANRYLAETPLPKMGSYVNGGAIIQYEVKETLDKITQIGSYRSNQLAAVKNVTPEFKRLEEARIKADVINSFNYVGIYAKYKQELSYAPGIYGQMFNAVAKQEKRKYQQNFVDASFMKLAVYRDIAEEMVKDEAENADVVKIKEWYKASALVDKMKRENDKAKLAAYASQADDINDPRYKAALKTYAQSLLKFGKGDTAVDFAAIDMDGKKVNLADLKGKIIYVDIWATWCIPCLQEMPALELVKKKYADNPNVIFVSLSIDDDNDLAKWKKNVSSRKANGYQWQINRVKLKAYNVTEIPRALLIDKDLKMLNMTAPMPSSKDLSATIDGLLAK
ncbi:TlpA family protein disulfide reductase [Mucilaginibacter antarcticus]|uniref:TlpA family protein disulfide reductase n=1 Tax=Mucilaginibacter antarcticus TaxID=1855725 RepID=A0ABW5XK71_9SPHI